MNPDKLGRITDESTRQNRCEHRPHPSCATTGKAQPGEAPGAAYKMSEVLGWALARARATYVKDRGNRRVMDLPARLPEAMTEIDFLLVEEITLIEASDGQEGLPPDSERGAENPVGRPGTPFIPVPE